MESFMPDSEQVPVPERLLRAAVIVFGEQGYTSSRVSDIVARAGVAQGTFYLYFKNKEAIFLKLIDDFFGRLLGGTLGRYPAGELHTTRDLTQQLGRMWHTILVRCREEPVLAMLVLRESYVLGPVARAQVDERFEHVAAAVCSYLEEVSQRGIIQLGMPAAASWAVLGIIERAIHYAVVVDPHADAAKLSDVFLSLELGGLLGAGDLFHQLEQSRPEEIF
jgi:AcrR family transcriptional regulator